METVQKLMEITSRIDHLESAAEWVTKETVHFDNAVSQSATLITVLADEIRERVYALVKQLEETTRATGPLH